MAPEERATKTADRCDLHPGSASVAMCDGCGRPLCISCAVPVRGEVFGSECLPPDLDPAGTALDQSAPPLRWPVVGGGICWVVAVVASVFPWTKFGSGTNAFGAWAWDERGSMLAAPAAIAGLVVWWLGRRRGPIAWWIWGQIVFGLEAAAGSLLSFWNPPPFTKPAAAPLVSALAAASAAAIALVTRTRATRASV